MATSKKSTTTINFITGNKNKLAEVQAMMADEKDIEITNQSLDVDEIQGSVEEIARDKCARAAELV